MTAAPINGTITRRGMLGGLGTVIALPKLVCAQSSANSVRIDFVPHTVNLLGSGQPSTEVWSAGDEWPASVLRARQGEEFRCLVTNKLDRGVSLHWHGIRAAADMMSVKVAPGAGNSFECVFTPPDAGTFWYGPVSDVSRLREMGLYGLLIVEESSLPQTFTDVPIVLDDWQLSETGAIEPDSFGSLEDAVGQGRLGNWFTVNGAYRPALAIPKGSLSRLRILNAANVRTMSLLFKGADPLIAAFDGQPVPLRNLGAVPLVLWPGQRCDVLVEEGGEEVTLALDLFEDIVEIGYLRRTGPDGVAKLDDNFVLPANPLPENLTLEGAVQASLVIEGGAGGGMKGARLNGGDLPLRALLERGFAWSFNGIAGLSTEPLLRCKIGSSVVIAVENRTRFDQPLHIHGHVWRVMARDGKNLDNQPWRDTAVAAAGETIQLAFVADNPGTWGLHATIAERVDSGLITSFAVDP